MTTTTGSLVPVIAVLLVAAAGAGACAFTARRRSATT
jgi:hypothetical protein